MRILIVVFSFFLSAFFSVARADGSAASVLLHSAAIGAEWMTEFNTGSVRIDRIELLEPNLIPKDYFDAVVEAYLGKDLKVKDLQDIQRRLSRYYVNRGFVSSGVVIPKQRILNGVIRLQPVHGRVTKIEVSGNRRVENEFFYALASKGLSVPVDFYEVQRALVLMKQNPFIRNVTAQIVPSETIGENILKLRVDEANSFKATVQAANVRSPSIGSERVGITLTHRNWPASRHSFIVDAGLTAGLADVSGSYGLPLGHTGAYINATGSYTDATVKDERLQATNLRSKSVGGGVNTVIPLFMRTSWDANVLAGVDYRAMETNDSIGISSNGQERVSVGSLGMQFNRHGSNLVGAFSAGVRYGFDALGATVASDNVPDGQFTSYNAQTYISGRLIGSSYFILRGTGQYTTDQLLPMEQFAVGGMHSVRGYRENLFVRDNGVVGSLEIRVPLYTPKFTFAVFSDAGRSWDVAELPGQQNRVASAGAGFVLSPFKRFNAEIYWGRALYKAEFTGTENLQDKGVHARIEFEVF